MVERFNPVYNSVEQVKNCVTSMLPGEVITEARIAIVIGHNGINFVSSTDWRLTTASGMKRVFTFSPRPQYPNFLECVSGVSYSGKQENFKVLPDEKGKQRSSIVLVNGKGYRFKPGKALKIYVEPGEVFVATDCLVSCIEKDGMRIYQVRTDENTLYGKLGEDGRASQFADF